MSQQQQRNERASDRRKVLGRNSGEMTFKGVPAPILVGAFVGAVVVGFFEHVIEINSYSLQYLFALVAVGISYVVMKHSPGHLPVHEHARRWVLHRIRQHTMVDTRKGSTKEQPTNDGLLGRLLSKPFVDNTRFFSRQGTERTADAVQLRRPFHNSPAIETVDGSVVGAIKVRPAAMAVADRGHWEQRVTRLANVIDSSVTGRVEFTSKMRAVNYANRVETYDAREQQLLATLASKYGSLDTAYERARNGQIDEDDLGLLVGADLADERQAVIDLYDVTTLTREYYVIVRVDPKDVIAPSAPRDDGGIANVPYLSKLWEHRRMRQIEKEGDHTKVLIDRLEDKIETLQRDLGTIEDISTHVLSSTEYSQVLADHYQAANVYANAGFKDLVRLSPQPAASDGTAMYGVTHDYINDMPTDRLSGSVIRDSEFESETEPASGAETGSGAGAGDGDGPETAITPDRAGERSAMGETETGLAESDGPTQRFSVPNRTGPTAESEESGETSVSGRVESMWEYVSEFASRTAAVNGDPISDILVSEEHLVDHYRTVIGPTDIYRGAAGWLALDRAVYSKTLSIRNWPAVPRMGILEPVLREHEPGVAVNVSTHISPVDQQVIRRELADEEKTRETSLKNLVGSKLPRVAQSHEEDYDEVAEMLEANRDSEYDVFRTNTHIELRSDDPAALARTVEHIEAEMNDAGAMVREETEYHYEGWQSVAPVCDDKLEEPVLMFADGVAREFPWTSRNLHEPNGVEFGINMHTEEPLYLDLWNRNTGYDFGIFTKKGGGKTTTATGILGRLNSVYRDDVMTIIIDPLQEFANLATVHGGERLVVGGDTGINPFHIEETPEEKLATIGKGAPYKHWLEGCMDFVEMYYNDEGLPFGEKKGVWRMAIREAAERYGIDSDPKTHAEEYRREQGYSGECPTPLDAIDIIDEIAENPEEWVRSGVDAEPAQRKIEERQNTAVKIINNDVQPFEPGGEYEHFTKQTDIDIHGSTFFYVDMQQQEASTSIGLTMQVVYDLFYEMVKTIDIPSVIFMDEFHYMLRDSIAQKSLNNKFRHGRHWDLSLGVATQSFKDFFGEDDEGNTHLTDNAQVLFENMPTQIFHYEDMDDEWANAIGLTADEADFIRNAEPGNRELGYSTALLRVSDKGTYPLKVKMDFEENPREAIVTEYDPSKHGEDLLEYLLAHDNICEWRFAPTSMRSEAKTLPTEHASGNGDDGSGPGPGSGTDSASTPSPEQNSGLDISAITSND